MHHFGSVVFVFLHYMLHEHVANDLLVKRDLKANRSIDSTKNALGAVFLTFTDLLKEKNRPEISVGMSVVRIIYGAIKSSVSKGFLYSAFVGTMYLP